MKLSVQCYTVRDDIDKDLWGTLTKLRDLGLNYVEIGGTFGVPVSEFKTGLDDLGLKVSANHVGLSQLESNIGAVIEENSILEVPCIVLPSVGKDRYSQGWATVAHDLEPIGERLLEAGFQFAYHNHSFEFREENGKSGLDILYETANPRLVQAQLDTYWAAYGGADAGAYIRKLTGRVPQVHLKDGRLGGEIEFLEIGYGDLNWADILMACDEAGVEFGSIELDVCPREPLESVRLSVEYLRAHGVTE